MVNATAHRGTFYAAPPYEGSPYNGTPSDTAAIPWDPGAPVPDGGAEAQRAALVQAEGLAGNCSDARLQGCRGEGAEGVLRRRVLQPRQLQLPARTEIIEINKNLK